MCSSDLAAEGPVKMDGPAVAVPQLLGESGRAAEQQYAEQAKKACHHAGLDADVFGKPRLCGSQGAAAALSRGASLRLTCSAWVKASARIALSTPYTARMFSGVRMSATGP